MGIFLLPKAGFYCYLDGKYLVNGHMVLPVHIKCMNIYSEFCIGSSPLLIPVGARMICISGMSKSSGQRISGSLGE